MTDTNLAIIILAAGKGSRMKSSLPKVMHKIAGRSMLAWLIDSCESLNPKQIIIVAAPDMDDVVEEANNHKVVFQTQQNGTGDAVKPALLELADFDGRILVLMGDEPFVDVNILQDMIAHDGLAFMAVSPENMIGAGRVELNNDGSLRQIIEEKDCDTAQLNIKIGSSGNFCFPSAGLKNWIEKLNTDNAQGEYYLTDIPAIAAQEGSATKVFESPISHNWGINTRKQLAEHEAYAQNMLRENAMVNGVTLIDPSSVTLSWDSEFGEDVIIEPNVFIGPWTSIGSNVTIHAFSHIEGAILEDGASVGPFARIRPKSIIERGASIGNFIEVNRSVVKAGAKAKHVSYLGDATIGENSNIGAGTIIANYDGFFKHKTHIGEKVFVGSNSTIIAPVKIGDGAIIAAGSNINKDIDVNALAIARSKQENHAGWATQYRYMKREQKDNEQDDD